MSLISALAKFGPWALGLLGALVVFLLGRKTGKAVAQSDEALRTGELVKHAQRHKLSVEKTAVQQRSQVIAQANRQGKTLTAEELERVTDEVFDP